MTDLSQHIENIKKLNERLREDGSEFRILKVTRAWREEDTGEDVVVPLYALAVVYKDSNNLGHYKAEHTILFYLGTDEESARTKLLKMTGAANQPVMEVGKELPATEGFGQFAK